MARKTQRDWFEAGINILIEMGAASLKIEVLTTQLGVTKGSFYHHFKDYQDYKEKLLNFIEEQGTLLVIDQLEDYGSPTEKLRQLMETTLSYSPQLEIALRGWASQDDQVRDFQQRIDQQRLNYLKDIYFEMTRNETQALTLAQMLMTIYIGSQQILPPLSKPQLEQVYLEIERLFRDLSESVKT